VLPSQYTFVKFLIDRAIDRKKSVSYGLLRRYYAYSEDSHNIDNRTLSILTRKNQSNEGCSLLAKKIGLGPLEVISEYLDYPYRKQELMAILYPKILDTDQNQINTEFKSTLEVGQNDE
jgi:hypothetical protein